MIFSASIKTTPPPQLMLPSCIIRRSHHASGHCAHFPGRNPVKSFTCLDQFLCMAFAQLTYRESLRDIEVACAHTGTNSIIWGYAAACHATPSPMPTRSATGASADFDALIRLARPLYADTWCWNSIIPSIRLVHHRPVPVRVPLGGQTKRLSNCIPSGLARNIPTFIHLSEGKLGATCCCPSRAPATSWAARFPTPVCPQIAAAFFVIRAKSNTRYRRRYSRPVDKATGPLCDQTIVLTGVRSATHYPQPLRRIKYRDPQTHKTFDFLTNHFALPAHTITELYRYRWQVELFFKWIKQHLRIKAFFGTSENAVKTQIWTAVSVYVLVALIKKRLQLTTELYTILQVLSLTLFEKIPLYQLLIQSDYKTDHRDILNQLNLFD